jgi:hypothetical protein
MSGGKIMATSADELALEIKSWPDLEKVRLVNALLSDLDKPDPELDDIWAKEARSRWAAYKAGKIPDGQLRRSDGQASPAMKIRFLALARQEVDDAAFWYGSQAEEKAQGIPRRTGSRRPFG